MLSLAGIFCVSKGGMAEFTEAAKGKYHELLSDPASDPQILREFLFESKKSLGALGQNKLGKSPNSVLKSIIEAISMTPRQIREKYANIEDSPRKQLEIQLQIILFIEKNILAQFNDPLPRQQRKQIQLLMQPLSFLLDPENGGFRKYIDKRLYPMYGSMIPKTIIKICQFFDVHVPEGLKNQFKTKRSRYAGNENKEKQTGKKPRLQTGSMPKPVAPQPPLGESRKAEETDIFQQIVAPNYSTTLLRGAYQRWGNSQLFKKHTIITKTKKKKESISLNPVSDVASSVVSAVRRSPRKLTARQNIGVTAGQTAEITKSKSRR